MTQPLIHLGLHRTGSTWFQSRVLDGRDGRPANAIGREETSRRIALVRDMDFHSSELRSWLQAEIGKASERDGHVVISNERFSGNPSGGWFDGAPFSRALGWKQISI